jgi:16S rRNA (guanine966-N2)-methyltransferase
MRIIAGLGKGRKIVSPSDITRPTSDRAREGLFSSLISRIGTLEDTNFLDLFAGSGAVGVEALSRGASLVEAVESDPKSAKVCEQNFNIISRLAGIGNFTVYNQTAFEFLNHNISKTYDIIFLDPPYQLANFEVDKLLKKILSSDILDLHGLIAIERDGKAQSFTWPVGLAEIKVRSYGAGRIHYGALSEPNEKQNG